MDYNDTAREKGGNGSARPVHRVRPETFSTSRLLDFASKRELTAQIGHSPDMWPEVVVKELADNALDATEETGTAPQVTVAVTENLIEVADNGPGIPGDVIEGILDFTVRVSSREAHVGPTRGAQGNALKTIVVMPFALDGNAGLVEVESRGVRHRIAVSIDRIAQEPRVEVRREPSLVKNGSIVRLHWPDSAKLNPDRRADRGQAAASPVRRVQPAPAPHRTGDADGRGHVGADRPPMEPLAAKRPGAGVLVRPGAVRAARRGHDPRRPFAWSGPHRPRAGRRVPRPLRHL
jgi:Histidine kinase-, DNA gyrase B-, and HSP90-like ATPase